MIAAIMAWFAAQNEARNRAHFEDGFDFAAGALLAGEPIEDVVLQASDDHPFDDGMKLAIKRWHEVVGKSAPLMGR